MKDGEGKERPGRIARSLALWSWAGTVLLAAGTGLGFAGRLAWWLELASHFRMQLFWGAVVVLVIFALLRRRRGLACAALLCAINGVVIAPLYVSESSNSPGAADRPILRLLIANVHASNRDHSRLLELVRREKPHILLLEEIDGSWLAALNALASDYPHRVLRARPGNFGIALLSRIPLELGEIRQYGTAGVPSIEARITHGGEPLQILLTHPVPPVGRDNAMRRDEQASVVAKAARALGRRTILAGDFNMTPWSPVFADLLESSGLRDSARGFGLQTTWPMTLPLPCRIPIDHCLHTPDLEVVDRRAGPDIGSDHLPLIVELR
jgi:endonuclease/exonuclease/phosphatase (EEP) superfamily protein YafD